MKVQIKRDTTRFSLFEIDKPVAILNTLIVISATGPPALFMQQNEHYDLFIYKEWSNFKLIYIRIFLDKYTQTKTCSLINWNKLIWQRFAMIIIHHLHDQIKQTKTLSTNLWKDGHSAMDFSTLQVFVSTKFSQSSPKT